MEFKFLAVQKIQRAGKLEEASTNGLAVTHSHFDLENPRHFINICPKKIREAAFSIPPEAFLWDERMIIRMAYEDNQVPEMDERLRLAFWAEYDRCFRLPQKMVQDNILRGICSRSFFESRYLAKWKIILLIITEPFEQKRSLNYAHHLSLSEMVKFIKLPIGIDVKTGLPDARMYAIKEKLFEYLNEKVNGSTIQKVDITQKSLNVNATITPDATRPLPQSPEEMEARIQELISQLSPAQAPTIILPTEAVIKEAGRVVDAEYLRLDKNRDNSHRE